MILKLEHNGLDYEIDSNRGIDLSIPNNFDGKAPIFFNALAPTIFPETSDHFIGDVSQGGSCNVSNVELNIHCNGTHTECVGHINNSGMRITDVCPKGFLYAQLMSVSSVLKSSTDESYHVQCDDDFVITKEAIQNSLSDKVDALIVRTLPNDDNKMTRNYDEFSTPFLTNEAIDYISNNGIKHILVDLPSIDRGDDEGQLGNHHRFFKTGKTITELIYIPNSVKDGLGFIQIHIPNWGLDAAPSRPIFYPI